MSVQCPKCDGSGWQQIEEDVGVFVGHACFYCGNTGLIPESRFKTYKLDQFINMVAGVLIAKKKQAMDEDPYGEGWAFHAAENGMSEYEYSMDRQMSEERRVHKELMEWVARRFGLPSTT